MKISLFKVVLINIYVQITYLSDKISAKDMAHQEICDRLKGLQDELHVCEHSLGELTFLSVMSYL